MSLSGLSFLRGLGIKGKDLTLLRRSDGLRGLFTTRSRAANEKIITVPFRSALTSSALMNQGIGRSVWQGAVRAGRRVEIETPTKLTLELTPFEATATTILALAQIETANTVAAVAANEQLSPQKRTAMVVKQLSPFQRYVRLLPFLEPTVEDEGRRQCFDSVEDGAFFSYHHAVDALASNLTDAAGQSSLTPTVDAMYNSDRDEEIANVMRWALYATRSRSLWLPTPRKGGSLLVDPWILPGIDFTNHSEEPNAKVVIDLKKQCVSLVTLRPLSYGEELLLLYHKPMAPIQELPGAKWDWQIHYGFVPLSCPV